MKREVTLKEMREIQMNILKNVHEFCIKNNIRYSLGGGTLLGAIRHKGYIPWDDDIDIMLPRPDYERFIKEFDGFSKTISIQHYKNDDSCALTFAKLFDTRTVLIDAHSKNGVFIDVFPIDGLPEADDYTLFYKEFDKLALNIARTTKYYKFQKNLRKFVFYCIKAIIFGKREKHISKFEEFLKSNPFDTSKKAGAVVGTYREKEIMDQSVFTSYVLLPFEEFEFYGIKEYDSYLTKHYGNYMQLPPEEKRISHHEQIVYWKN